MAKSSADQKEDKNSSHICPKRSSKCTRLWGRYLVKSEGFGMVESHYIRHKSNKTFYHKNTATVKHRGDSSVVWGYLNGSGPEQPNNLIDGVMNSALCQKILKEIIILFPYAHKLCYPARVVMGRWRLMECMKPYCVDTVLVCCSIATSAGY